MSEDHAAEPRLQRPAILIGMGGTGKQVLLNLRRMFYDRFGRPSLPHLGHLWIDTDTRNVTIDGKEMDFLLKEVDFQANERVGTELRPSDLEHYYEHPENFGHIFSWFDTSLQRFGRIHDGAGQIRSFGRLAFFRHYEEIMGRVREKHGQIRDANQQNDLMGNYNIRLDTTATDAWIILSLAGGTGSGMFLDMAFALKHFNPDIHVRALLVLPSVFNNDTREKIYANTYAALMELEHYNFGKRAAPGQTGIDPHRFPIAWTEEQYREGGSLPGPVFETAYLIGNQPRSTGGALNLPDKNALCDMLSEFLFIEYAGVAEGLASSWRSQRSNFAGPLTSIIAYDYSGRGREFKEFYCCRYSSIGLAKLYVPINRIIAIVRHRLAIDLIDHWTRRSEIPADFDEILARQYFPELLVLARKGSAPPFFAALNGSGTQGQLVTDRVRQLVVERRSQILGNAGGASVGTDLLNWLKDDLLINQLDCSNPIRDRWGALSRLIYTQNSEALFERIVGALDRMMNDILKSPHQGFVLAREALRRVSAQLSQQAADFQSRSERSRAKGTSLHREIVERLEWLDDCHGLFTRKTILEVALNLAEERVEAEARAQLLDAGAKVSRRLADFIGSGVTKKDAQGREIITETGLIAQLSSLERKLTQDVADEMRQRMAALQKMPSSPINQSLYDAKDFDDYYIDQEGKQIDRDSLAELDRRFFEEYGNRGMPSLWGSRAFLEEQGAERFLGYLLDYSRRATAYLDQRSDSDVIDRLGRRHKPNSEQFGDSVRRLLNFGQPWLSQANHFVDRDKTMRHTRNASWIASSGAGSNHNHTTFRSSMNKISEGRLSQVECSPDKTYVSSEMAGFPLMAIPDLDRYRDQSYYPYLQKGEVLHTDIVYEKFQDLMIRRKEEVEVHLDALEVLAAGILTGVIKGQKRSNITGKTGFVEFSFKDESGLFPRGIELGPFSLALRRLTLEANRELFDNIRARAEDVINRLDEDGLGRWYYLLRLHAEKSPVIQPGFSIVLTARADELVKLNPHVEESAMRQKPSFRNWSVENPAGSGFHALNPDEGFSL